MTPALSDLAAAFARLAGPPASVGAPPSTSAADPNPAAASIAPPPAPVQETQFAAKGYHLDVTVDAQNVVAAAELLDRNGFGMDAITGVDWLAQQQMEVVYDYFHPTAPWRAVVRTRVPRANPEIPTISGVFPGANWHERETHDFYGIVFTGHPQLEPLLLPEDATYHPLRKDFQA